MYLIKCQMLQSFSLHAGESGGEWVGLGPIQSYLDLWRRGFLGMVLHSLVVKPNFHPQKVAKSYPKYPLNAHRFLAECLHGWVPFAGTTPKAIGGRAFLGG